MGVSSLQGQVGRGAAGSLQPWGSWLGPQTPACTPSGSSLGFLVPGTQKHVPRQACGPQGTLLLTPSFQGPDRVLSPQSGPGSSSLSLWSSSPTFPHDPASSVNPHPSRLRQRVLFSNFWGVRPLLLA